MTQGEKQLLLRDLLSRILYGVKAEVRGWDGEKEGEVLVPVTIYSINPDGYVHFCDNAYDITYCRIEECRPYLRPFSTMTEKEQFEFEEMFNLPFAAGYDTVTKETIVYDSIVIDKGYSVEIYIDDIALMLDWLLSHHFDCHNLIQKGLAIEAPEGMYKND